MTKCNVYKILLLLCMAACFLSPQALHAQADTSLPLPSNAKPQPSQKIYYGLASYYADSFHGKKTASGEIFSQQKLTAACNILPLGTWIKVTNLKNGKSVVVKTTDRLHPRMRRIVDLSRSAAQKLDYISQGLTRVKVEVLPKKP